MEGIAPRVRAHLAHHHTQLTPADQLKLLIELNKTDNGGILNTRDLARTVMDSEDPAATAKEILSLMESEHYSPIDIAHFREDFHDAQYEMEKKKKLNPFRIIAEELPKWVWSEETKDLRDGLDMSTDIALNVAAIEYKAIGVLMDMDAVDSVANHISHGENGEAAIEIVSLIAGKTTTRLIHGLGHSDRVSNASGLISSKITPKLIEDDCYSCKQNK